MERERRLVRDDALPLGPEPRGHELLVLAGREVDEPVDTALDAGCGPARQVVHEELRRVAGLGGLLRREEAVLGGGDLVEAVPVGTLRGTRDHARNVSHALVSCKGTRLTKLKQRFSFVRTPRPKR